MANWATVSQIGDWQPATGNRATGQLWRRWALQRRFTVGRTASPLRSRSTPYRLLMQAGSRYRSPAIRAWLLAMSSRLPTAASASGAIFSGAEREALASLIENQSPSEDFDAAATRLWSAAECLKKAGFRSIRQSCCLGPDCGSMGGPRSRYRDDCDLGRCCARTAGTAGYRFAWGAAMNYYEYRHLRRVRRDELNRQCVLCITVFAGRAVAAKCFCATCTGHHRTIAKGLAGDDALWCEYFSELRTFDEIAVRMRLASITQSRLELDFEYWRTNADGEELVARGRQGVACLRRLGINSRRYQFPMNSAKLSNPMARAKFGHGKVRLKPHAQQCSRTSVYHG